MTNEEIKNTLHKPFVIKNFIDSTTIDVLRIYYKNIVHDNLGRIINMSAKFGSIAYTEEVGEDMCIKSRLVLGNFEVMTRGLAALVQTRLEKEITGAKLELSNLLPILNLPTNEVLPHMDKMEMGDYTSVLNIFFEGRTEMEYFVDDERFVLGEGDLIVFPSVCWHSTKALGDDEYRMNMVAMYYDLNSPTHRLFYEDRVNQLQQPGFKVKPAFTGPLSDLIELEK